MELGLTWPLQRFLKAAAPVYGTEMDRRFCWDVHNISLRGRNSLLAVHCHSRYTFVLFDLSRPEWGDLTATFLGGLCRSLTAAGIPANVQEHYLKCAGALQITRTHGRREVAFLNRAWDDVMVLDHCLDTACREQPLLDHAVNSKPSRCVGFDGLAPAAGRIAGSIG